MKEAKFLDNGLVLAGTFRMWFHDHQAISPVQLFKLLNDINDNTDIILKRGGFDFYSVKTDSFVLVHSVQQNLRANLMRILKSYQEIFSHVSSDLPASVQMKLNAGLYKGDLMVSEGICLGQTYLLSVRLADAASERERALAMDAELFADCFGGIACEQSSVKISTTKNLAVCLLSEGDIDSILAKYGA